MPNSPVFVSPTNPNFLQELKDIETTPGYCIFIDIVGSTIMKQNEFHKWVTLIYNSFTNMRTYLFQFHPLKGIGDELMFYIEESDLIKADVSPLQLYDALFEIASDRSDYFPETKICAAYCTTVYPITFLKGVRDYYGIDIDKTARLKGVKPDLAPREIIIDHEFYLHIKCRIDAIGDSEQFPSFKNLTGPSEYSAKGVMEVMNFYRARA